MRNTDERRTFMFAALALAAGGSMGEARACEFVGSTLRVTHPWTRATVHGADTAVLCMKFDQVTRNDRLIGVHTRIAEGAVLSTAEPGTPLDLPIAQGSELELSEQGLHIRLTGLTAPLQVGRTYPLELTFAEGGVVLAELSVDFTTMRFL